VSCRHIVTVAPPRTPERRAGETVGSAAAPPLRVLSRGVFAQFLSQVVSAVFSRRKWSIVFSRIRTCGPSHSACWVDVALGPRARRARCWLRRRALAESFVSSLVRLGGPAPLDIGRCFLDISRPPAGW